jgi:hypothetical protein
MPIAELGIPIQIRTLDNMNVDVIVHAIVAYFGHANRQTVIREVADYG